MMVCKKCGKQFDHISEVCNCTPLANNSYISTSEEGKPVGGLRYNSGKRRMDLIPISALNSLADVLTKGAEKYAERNWEKGMDHSVCYASLMRHITKWYSGEDMDEESGLSHLDHAICNVAFLIEYSSTHPELDDRPNKPKVKACKCKDKCSAVTHNGLTDNDLEDMENEELEQDMFWRDRLYLNNLMND